MNPIIIIGTGLAGYECAKELRKLDTTTPLFIITASMGGYYSKPLLSTAITQGKEPEMLIVADASTMATRLNATILTQTLVTAIDTQQQSVSFNNKTLNYSRLVLACGAKTISPPILGDCQHILSVNNLEDYMEFRSAIKQKKHIAILGAGLVGCEFANDLLNNGFAVDIIAPANYPLDSLVPQAIGLTLQTALSEKGARWHLGHLVNEIKQTDTGFVLALSGRGEIKADIVLSAIGLQPQIEIAEAAGIKTNRGVIVDEYLEASAKNVFALGDCVEMNGTVLPYVAPLLHGARALAKTLAGTPTAVDYPIMPVVIKTPSCPVVVAPPARGTKGEWQITGDNTNLTALFYNEQGSLLGFALTGAAVKEKMVVMKQMAG